MEQPTPVKKLPFKSKESRRTKKYINVLCRDYDYKTEEIEKSHNNSATVALCNVGFSTGISKEQLLQVAMKYGPVKDIILHPGKSISFICYFSQESAFNAFNNMHCCKVDEIKADGEMYLVFVPDAPCNASSDAWQTTKLPEGFQLIPDIVTGEEESLLLNELNWSSPSTGKSLKHRNVLHFGYEFDYSINNVHPDDPLSEQFPAQCDVVIDRLIQQRIVTNRPDQLTVNQYMPGQGIPPHIDTHSAFDGSILSLSLGSDIVMEFRQDDVLIPVLLPRRSLLIMQDEARYCWSHGITPRKSDIVPSPTGGMTLQPRNTRVSFTFRRLLRKVCTCKYPKYCDSQQSTNTSITNVLETHASNVEDLHVHQVYNQIAEHFSDTRYKPWPNVKAFVQSQDVGSIFLDVGCGNGKYLGLNGSSFSVGCDSSIPLLKVCEERGHEVFTCNCLQLPLRNESVDFCISIAVIHHLASEERRLQALREMQRVMRPGGKALVYVWAKDQEKNNVKSSYLRQQGTSKSNNESVLESPYSLPVHTNRTQFSDPDMLVPWKLHKSKKQESEKVFYRYYHLFEEGELESLCGLINDFSITKSYYDQGNWCVVLEKNS